MYVYRYILYIDYIYVVYNDIHDFPCRLTMPAISSYHQVWSDTFGSIRCRSFSTGASAHVVYLGFRDFLIIFDMFFFVFWQPSRFFKALTG